MSSRLVDERATPEASFLLSYLTNLPTERVLVSREMYPTVAANGGMGGMGGMGF